MHTWLRLSAGVAAGCLLWTGTALGQAPPACDQQGKVKTPERVGGEVTKVDMAQGRVTVRESDGTVREFQASKETLQNVKVGGRVEAQLQRGAQVPVAKCP
jgi:hypothetical protein